MRKHFIKVYSETGKKPFTFLNAVLCFALPVAVLFIPDTGTASLIAVILLILLCFAINAGVQFLRFKNVGKALALTGLNILASIAFWTKLVIWPLTKFLFRASSAMTSVQTGNFQDANNQLNTAAAGGNKQSAFYWFNYNGIPVNTSDAG